MQHSNNGAVLASTGGAGRGRRVPGPSPALISNYTNSPASTPSAEPKGPSLMLKKVEQAQADEARRQARLSMAFYSEREVAML